MISLPGIGIFFAQFKPELKRVEESRVGTHESTEHREGLSRPTSEG